MTFALLDFDREYHAYSRPELSVIEISAAIQTVTTRRVTWRQQQCLRPGMDTSGNGTFSPFGVVTDYFRF